MINSLHQNTTVALVRELLLRKDITPDQADQLIVLGIEFAEFVEIAAADLFDE